MNGEIFTLGLLNDFAITGTNGQDKLENLAGGWIIGSVDLDFGLGGGVGNTVTNQNGGVFIAGSDVDLGDSTDTTNVFTNNGTLSIGSARNTNNKLQLEPTLKYEEPLPTALAFSSLLSFSLPAEFSPTLDGLSLTTITGNFVQGSDGNTIADLAFDTNDKGIPGNDEMDRIYVTGTASLDGQLQLIPITGAASAGTYTIPFLYAQGGVTNSGLSIHPQFLNGTSSTTATFTPSLNWDDPDLVQLTYTVDYCPDGLTINQGSYCSAVTRIQDYGWPAYEEVAANILRVVDLSDLKKVYDSLDGEGIIGAAEAQHSSARQSGDTLDKLSSIGVECIVDRNFYYNERCNKLVQFWIGGAYRAEEAFGDGNSASYHAAVDNASFGAVLVGENKYVNICWGANKGEYAIPDRWMKGDSSGKWIGVGAGVSSDLGIYVNADVSFGRNHSDYERIAWGYSLDGNLDPHNVKGDFRAGVLQTSMEAGWIANLGGYAKMHVYGEYNLVSTHRREFKEQDAVWGNHYFDDRVVDQFATLGVSLATMVDITNQASIEPYVAFEVTEALDLEKRKITARSLAADAEGFEWEALGATPDYSRYQWTLGLKVRAANDLTIDAMVATWDTSRFGKNSIAQVGVVWQF